MTVVPNDDYGEVDAGSYVGYGGNNGYDITGTLRVNKYN